MKSRILISAVGILLLIAVLNFVAAHEIRVRFEQAGKDMCPTCELHIGRVAVLPLWWGRLRMTALSWKSGSGGALEISAAARALDVSVSLRELLRKKVDLWDVNFTDLEIGLTDGESKEPPDKEAAPEDDKESEWTVIVRQINTKGAEFTYVRNKKGTHAKLNVHDINLHVGEFGLQKQWLELPVKAKADLRLEKSGAITLEVATYLKKPQRVDVALFVKDQQLNDLSPFFKENAGVTLGGELIEGKGTVHIVDNGGEATVLARYRDLKVNISEMYDRNEITAFFMSLGTSIGMSKKDTGKPLDNQVRSKKLEREPHEPIVGFVLRGLKEAAISVTLAP